MKFTESHDWVKVEGKIATIGITDHAQKELGDIVYVELPHVGKKIHSGDEVIVLESTKAAVDIYTPVSGEIFSVNEQLREHPEKVNQSPESEGWLFKIKLSALAELDALMDLAQYRKFLGK